MLWVWILYCYLAKLAFPARTGPGRANRRVEKNHIPLFETKSRNFGIGFVKSYTVALLARQTYGGLVSYDVNR